MITQQTIEEVKSRIDIIDIVGQFVQLRKRGANYIGLCPFHNEKTPSFSVSPTKEIYKCFGCGKSGNAISFLMDHEKMSYTEAIRWLAEKYHIEIEETESSPEQKLFRQKSDSLHIINEFARKFFEEQLWNTDEGKSEALSYLKERSFSQETIKKFQLGYAPKKREVLGPELIKNQFNEDLLLETGLVVKRNDTFLDNYSGRIIFPIQSNSGKIIGFGARVIGKAVNAPKYINTPENELFVKNKVLYGIYFARQSIQKENECLLVEGYTDVISLHQAGITNVVSSSGTSLTVNQLRNIRKFTNNLTIIYDGDAAGIKAALRGLDMALEEGLNVKLVLIPGADDPDSYVRKIGQEAFRTFIRENKKDFILFELEMLLKESGDDLGRKSEVVNHIAESLSKIDRTQDFLKLSEYTKKCAQLLHIEESGLTAIINESKRNRIKKEFNVQERKDQTESRESSQHKDPSQTEQVLKAGSDEGIEQNMLRTLLEYGLKDWNEEISIAQYIFSELEQFSFSNPDFEKIYNEYRRLYEEGKEPDYKVMMNGIDEKQNQIIIELSVSRFELSQKWDDVLEGMNILGRDNSIAITREAVRFFKLKKVGHMIKANLDDIRKAQEAKNHEDLLKLITVQQQLNKIEKELTSHLGTVIIK